MKISSLDFLADLELRLLKLLKQSGDTALPVFDRQFNFSDKTMLLKVSQAGLLIGKLQCRTVEEPQDFYIRGTFYPESGSASYFFTLRPGKEYEKEISRLVDIISAEFVKTAETAS